MCGSIIHALALHIFMWHYLKTVDVSEPYNYVSSHVSCILYRVSEQQRHIESKVGVCIIKTCAKFFSENFECLPKGGLGASLELHIGLLVFRWSEFASAVTNGECKPEGYFSNPGLRV